MSVYDRFNRLLQGRAPLPAATMRRPFQLPDGQVPPMARMPGARPPQSAMTANQQLSPMMQQILRNAQASRMAPRAGQVGPAGSAGQQQPAAGMTFGQKLMQPRAQGMLGAAAAGFEASGYQDRPVSLGQVLGRMGTAGMKAYTAAEDRIAAQKVATEKARLDRMLAEAQLIKAKRPELTPLLKNLAAAGIDPNSPEGQKLIMNYITKPGTTINTGGESVFLKEGIKAGFQTIKEAQTDIKTDATLAPRVMQIIDLIEGGAETGKIQSATMGLRQLGKELGFLSDEQVSSLRDQEVLRSAMSYMVPRMRVTGSGASSDRDMAFFAQAAPMMTNTPEGNLIIAKMFKQLMDYNKKRLTLMGKTLKKDKNLLGFEEAADAELGAFYQRVKTQDELDALVESEAIKEGDVFYNGLAGEFQILGRD